MPYWILAQCDPYLSASSKAQAAFKSVFSEVKQPEVINFTKHEILNVKKPLALLTLLINLKINLGYL